MDTWLNPVTADYEPAGGSLQRDPAAGLANAVYLRLVTPLGSWFGDVTLGSRLHELQREKNVARVEKLAQRYAEEALRPLVEDGRISALTVSTERINDASGGGRLALAVQVVDALGTPSVFRVFVKVV